MMYTFLSSFKLYLLAFLLITGSLLTPILSQDIEVGENLFKSNCSSCHYLGPEEKKLIGPGLDAEIFEEHSDESDFYSDYNSDEEYDDYF